MRKKIKTKWYNEGERSTKYFLNQLKSRSKKQKITTLIENGCKITTPEEIEKITLDFYKDLYLEKEYNCDLEHEETLINLIDELESDQILEIENQLDIKELLSTLKSTKDSAPGPDGITYSFLKFLWPIYGKILIESWNYSLLTGKLPPSHNTSTLTLLPKEGKNLEELKNWRPITLSNCDLKLITKTLSKRMIKSLHNVIKDHQSAYMENRTISDNLRIINLSLREAELTRQPIYIIALDAKKAFDSVRHSFIYKILRRLGLHGFSETFKMLYHEQNIRISLNGKLTEQYFPTRGVKQGDALSCIIFNLVIEIILRSINLDESISKQKIGKLVNNLPTAVGYADDITCIVNNTDDIQKIFNHYEKFTKVSGLELNADKTEILSNKHGESCNIEYLGRKHDITSSCRAKINGIIFDSNSNLQFKENWDLGLKRMEDQLIRWQARSITTLGKIQLYKTFGMSQVLYLSRVLPPDEYYLKKVKLLTDKFLWNKSMNRNKAPSRIKDEITYTPTSSGGFGLTHLNEIVTSMNLKQILMNKHCCSPLKKLTHETVNTQTFPVKFYHLDKVVSNAELVLTGIYQRNIDNDIKCNLKDMANKIYSTKIRNVIFKEYIESMWAFRNKIKNKIISDLDVCSYKNKIPIKLYRILEEYKLEKPSDLIFNPSTGRGKHENSWKSSDLRKMMYTKEIICLTKSGLIMSNNEAKSLYLKIKKIKSIWNRNSTLRIIHGDLWYNSKLFLTGLRESNTCSRCDEVGDFMHTVFECNSIDSLWHKIKSIFYIDCENYEVMAHSNLNHLSLALISQIIYNRIKLDPKEEKKYRSDNKFIASHITYLINRETNINNQIFLKTLLDNLSQKISILKVNNMHLDIY